MTDEKSLHLINDAILASARGDKKAAHRANIALVRHKAAGRDIEDPYSIRALQTVKNLEGQL